MQPFKDNDLRLVLEKQNKLIRNKIDSFSNEEILANDIDILAENIYQEFFIEPVEIGNESLNERKIVQSKITRSIEPFMRDIYGKTTIQTDGMIFKFTFPFSGDKELFKCYASTFSLSGYPNIEISKNSIVITIEKTLNEMSLDDSKEVLLKQLKNDIDSIRSGISYCNRDVNNFNASLKNGVTILINEKKKKVESYYAIASMFEVPVTRNDFAATHISIKRKIAPISHCYDKKEYYCINDKEYEDILNAIKHTVSTYERTPSSYKSMHEEDLRNALLATLNAMYQGGVMGEAFRNNGKTDISIERENRAAFVAECKMWTGQKEIGNAIHQLDSYLTWRDCKTALIYFVRRKDFLKVMQVAKTTIENLENVRQIVEIDKNELKCLIVSNSNPGQLIQMRVFLFNLYSE